MQQELSRWPEASSPEKVAYAIRHLESFEFSALDLTRDDLVHVLLAVFQSNSVMDIVGISEMKMRRFILASRRRMWQLPFHNFCHVCDVVQHVHALLTSTGLHKQLPHTDQFALLVAALCHDLEHPGVSNVELALKYSLGPADAYSTVLSLEEHHASVALELISDKDIDLFSEAEPGTLQAFKSTVTGIIMATDMRHHDDYCRRLHSGDDVLGVSRLSRTGGPAAEEDAAQGDLNQFIMQVLLKAADVCNVVKPFHVAKKWAVRITDEHFAQGDLECRSRLPVTPSYDRRSNTRVGAQLNFIRIIRPFFSSVCGLFPALQRPLMVQLAENEAQWGYYTDEVLLLEEGTFPSYGSCNPRSSIGSSMSATPTTSQPPPIRRAGDRHESHDVEITINMQPPTSLPLGVFAHVRDDKYEHVRDDKLSGRHMGADNV